MSNYRSAAEQAAKAHFSSARDQQIFLRQMKQEAGFTDATSPAGAQGPAQIMPATAAAWGVKNVHDPHEAYNAAARNMAKYLRSYGGDWSKALTAYNAGPARVGGPLPAETQNYIKTILGGSSTKAGRTVTDVARSKASGGTPGTPGTPASTDTAGAIVDALVSGSHKLQHVGSGSSLLSRANQLISTGQYDTAATPGTPGTPARTTKDVAKGKAAAGPGKFTVTGADPGRLQPSLLAFANKVSAQYGHPLTGDSGATHSKMTVDGNVSQHYTGNATDIPASGATLLAMGRAALIAAGMPRAQAMKQTGGLFNVGSHQIIFLTNQGGNHFNHLHISAR